MIIFILVAVIVFVVAAVNPVDFGIQRTSVILYILYVHAKHLVVGGDQL